MLPPVETVNVPLPAMAPFIAMLLLPLTAVPATTYGKEPEILLPPVNVSEVALVMDRVLLKEGMAARSEILPAPVAVPVPPDEVIAPILMELDVVEFVPPAIKYT